jgi:hypothetical protein
MVALVLPWLPPLPPPAEVIELNVDDDPLVEADELFIPPLPPAPTVMVYEVPAVTAKAVPVLKPPAPPPPVPPPPPPATTKYSTSVTPAGQTHVVDEVKVWMMVYGPAPPGFRKPKSALRNPGIIFRLR